MISIDAGQLKGQSGAKMNCGLWEHTQSDLASIWKSVSQILHSVTISGKLIWKLIFNQASDDVWQQLSWGFRAFHELVWSRFDTPSFRRWSGDKINSCHLYGTDGEMCGLADDWRYHDNQEIFSSETIMWFFSSLPSPLYLLPQRVCTCIRGWLPVFRCDVRAASVPWYFCVWGATLTKQTCGGGMCVLNPILCLQEKSNRLRCYLMENLISGCGGNWGAPTTHGEDSGSDNRAGTPSATAHQFLYFIFEKLDFIL